MRASPTSPAPSRVAWLLGAAGLLPFVAGAIALWVAEVEMHARAAQVLVAYAATILAFLGGLHWGVAARTGQQPAQFVWGVTPSLLGCAALLLPVHAALPLLAASLVACYLVDRRVLPAVGLAGWLPLRAVLTTVAAASCSAAAMAVR